MKLDASFAFLFPKCPCIILAKKSQVAIIQFFLHLANMDAAWNLLDY